MIIDLANIYYQFSQLKSTQLGNNQTSQLFSHVSTNIVLQSEALIVAIKKWRNNVSREINVIVQNFFFLILFKVVLSPSKKWFYLLQWKPFKMMKNAFYFILKALFVLHFSFFVFNFNLDVLVMLKK